MTEKDFKDLGQPPWSKLETLPIWTREWIEFLKRRLMYWRARIDGRRVEIHGRKIFEPAPERIFALPVWAQDWIDTLKAEVIASRDSARARMHQPDTTYADWE